MTPEQMEKAIEFVVEHHARFSVEMEALKQAVASLVQSTASLGQEVHEGFTQAEARMARFEAQAESDRQEIREAIENLIIANEVTRDLAQKVATLQIQMSRRVDDIDRRVGDLESK